MNDKTRVGRLAENLVRSEIVERSNHRIVNLNDLRKNHPIVDLRVSDRKTGKSYDVSVKAKRGHVWPAVRGVRSRNQFMVFVDASDVRETSFYILTYSEWISTLQRIKPQRDAGSMIVNGALEWNWKEGGVLKRFRGSQICLEDISRFKSRWASLPGCR